MTSCRNFVAPAERTVFCNKPLQMNRLSEAQSLQFCRTQTINYPYLLLNSSCKTETMYHQATYIAAASHGDHLLNYKVA